MEVMIVVIKRISSILVACVVAMSMTGCNIGVDDTELLERKVQQLEQQIEDMEQAKDVVEEQLEQEEQQIPKMEQEAKEIETKVKEQPKQQVKQQPKQEQVKQQEINDEEQVKSGHTAYDESDDRINDVIDAREDYWHTDGDLPNNQPTTYESNEPKVIINGYDIIESQEYVEQFNY
jgi:TolA-binding protein